ncbi:MAG: protein phosphatase 2C domain-containing protein [Anaerolineales bacterium]
MTSFLNRLFHKKIPENIASKKQNSALEQSRSLDLSTDTMVTDKEAINTPILKTHLEIPQLQVGVAQSVGLQRDHNEDSLFTLTTNLATNERTINCGLYIIADGMGGHDNGELASRLAVGKLASHVINTLYKPLITSSSDGLEISIQEAMQAGVLQAHHAVKSETEGGGTTLTAALILGDQITITHVGDSRAYTVEPDGTLQLLTHDHSLVKRLVEIGQISPEQALVHPQRNVLYRALGQGDPFEPDIFSFQVRHGCQLLICSDGLWGVIPDSEMARIISSSPDPQIICQSLIDSANEVGGPDNISVILVRFPD